MSDLVHSRFTIANQTRTQSKNLKAKGMDFTEDNSTFIERISREACHSEATRHDYLIALKDGQFPNMALAFQDFAHQYGFYSEYFTRYLRAVIGNLKVPAHRKVLMENLEEEQGNAHDVQLPPEILRVIEGQPHALLFRKFQQSVGITQQNENPILDKDQPGIRWRNEFLSLCQQNEFVGLGAIGVGTELIVSKIYKHILSGLRDHTSLTRIESIFFELHCDCDDEHAKQLLHITRDLVTSPSEFKDVEFGAKEALKLRVAFWQEMLQRAQQMPPHLTSTERLAAIGY